MELQPDVSGRWIYVDISSNYGDILTTTVPRDLLFERIQELLNNQLRRLTNKLEVELRKARQGQSKE